MQISGIKDKHVLVTGAAGLLASDICKALAQNGAKLSLLDIAEDRLKDLCKVLKDDQTPVYCAPKTDLTNTQDVDALITDVEKNLGPVDVLIHAAYPRTADWHLKLEKIPVASWRENVDQHLTGSFVLSQQLGERMAKRGQGNLIFFSSIYGLVGPDFNVYAGLDHMTMPAAYAAIKGGISNYVRYLASYWGPSGIRVNAICPGGVQDNQHPSFIANYNQRVPLRRMAHKDEIIGPTLFLTSDISSYVTGTNLAVDGGWTAI